jgi:hypothetical protein
MGTLQSMLLSLLPKKSRRIFSVHDVPSEGALLSGIFEALAGTGLLIHGYFAYSNERLASMPVSVMSKAAAVGGESAVMGLGNILLLEYIFQLTTIILLWLTLEGGVRAVAAIVGEVIPSLPLSVLVFLLEKLGGQYKEKQLGERVRDEIQPIAGKGALQIASCRPKLWNQLTTISHEGQFYELVGEKKGQKPRPFIYLLRKKPINSVIRGIHAYDPDEALHAH